MSKTIWKITRWIWTALVFFYVVLIIVRIPHAINKQRTDKVVAKIHATKLTLDDAMGKNLPPNPGAEADKTLAGIDVNRNGIRDDVELAVFKEYPHSARTRSVLLQYALVLQMEMIQPIVNTDVVIAVAQERSRAAGCIAESESRSDIKKFIATTRKFNDLVKQLQINDNARNIAEAKFLENIGSYMDPIGEDCDLVLNSLSN